MGRLNAFYRCWKPKACVVGPEEWAAYRTRSGILLEGFFSFVRHVLHRGYGGRTRGLELNIHVVLDPAKPFRGINTLNE